MNCHVGGPLRRDPHLLDGETLPDEALLPQEVTMAEEKKKDVEEANQTREGEGLWHFSVTELQLAGLKKTPWNSRVIQKSCIFHV